MFLLTELEEFERLMMIPPERNEKKARCCRQCSSSYGDSPFIAVPPAVQEGCSRCFGATLAQRIATETLDTSEPKIANLSFELLNLDERMSELLESQQAVMRWARMLFPIAEKRYRQPTCEGRTKNTASESRYWSLSRKMCVTSG